MLQVLVFPPNAHGDILTLKGDGIRRWEFWSWLGHDSGANLWNGISSFIKETLWAL